MRLMRYTCFAADTDFFASLTLGSLITPGFGGPVYLPTGNGFILLQAMPKPTLQALSQARRPGFCAI